MEGICVFSHRELKRAYRLSQIILHQSKIETSGDTHYCLKAYSTCPPEMEIISLAVVEPAIPCVT